MGIYTPFQRSFLSSNSSFLSSKSLNTPTRSSIPQTFLSGATDIDVMNGNWVCESTSRQSRKDNQKAESERGLLLYLRKSLSETYRGSGARILLQFLITQSTIPHLGGKIKGGSIIGFCCLAPSSTGVPGGNEGGGVGWVLYAEGGRGLWKWVGGWGIGGRGGWEVARLGSLLLQIG